MNLSISDIVCISIMGLCGLITTGCLLCDMAGSFYRLIKSICQDDEEDDE